MNSASGIIKLIAVLVVVVALGVTIGWLGSSRESAPVEVTQVPATVPEPDPEPFVPVRPVTPAPPVTAHNNAPVNPSAVTQVPVPAPQNVLTNWEETLDEILGSEEHDETQKARQMAAILPRLPEEGQVEVAQHLSNLVADEDYGTISGFLTNTNFSEEVLDVFIGDSLNRPNAVKLPLLLDVARTPSHPKAEEAREILELFLEEDYGNDWAQWQSKLQEWMVNNPD